MATGGAENFSFHSLQHRVLKFAKQTPGQKNFSLTYYYNLNRAKWLGTEPGNKKSSKSFSDLLLSLAAGDGWYSVLKTHFTLV